jgi:hypothetical protein
LIGREYVLVVSECDAEVKMEEGDARGKRLGGEIGWAKEEMRGA